MSFQWENGSCDSWTAPITTFPLPFYLNHPVYQAFFQFVNDFLAHVNPLRTASQLLPFHHPLELVTIGTRKFVTSSLLLPPKWKHWTLLHHMSSLANFVRSTRGTFFYCSSCKWVRRRVTAPTPTHRCISFLCSQVCLINSFWVMEFVLPANFIASCKGSQSYCTKASLRWGEVK